MGKYIKLFENHAQYTAYTASTEFIKPNVSHCKEEVEVHYNPWVETRLVATFDVESGNPETLIYGTMECCDVSVLECFSKIEVDGVEVSLADLDENYGFYQLSEGIHNIKYTLLDPTEISSNAFYQCYKLTSILIPDSVTSIGYSAFYYCSNLTNIDIPSGVTSIDASAFGGCSSLTSVNIPSGVTSIGEAAFADCRSLTNIDIPSGVTSIGESAFGGCTRLTSINIPSGVTSIGNTTFDGCSGLTSIDIPSGVTSIGANAFRNCSSLTSIISNATIAPTINSYTFKNVKSNGILYVPIGSSGYDTWMQNANYYLGKYSWTKVEQ